MPTYDEDEWSDAVNDKAKETPAVTLQRKFIRQQKVRDRFNKQAEKYNSPLRSTYPTTRSSEAINAAIDPGEADMIRYMKPKDQINASP